MILVKEAVKTLAIIVVEAHIKEDAQLAHLNVKESAKELVEELVVIRANATNVQIFAKVAAMEVAMVRVNPPQKAEIQ